MPVMPRVICINLFSTNFFNKLSKKKFYSSRENPIFIALHIKSEKKVSLCAGIEKAIEKLSHFYILSL